MSDAKKVSDFYSYVRGKTLQYSSLTKQEKSELVKEYLRVKAGAGVVITQKSIDGKSDVFVGKIKRQASSANA